MDIRSEVIAEITRVSEEHNKRLTLLVDDLRLLESGLDSLCFAVVVARLEDTLGIDPFSAAEEAPFPITLGEFVKSYENAGA